MSCRGYSVSSPRLQFRRACGGDSAQVVTPFVQVGRRLPGLRFKASPPKGLTSPLNLPAPGRRQCLYVVLFDFADTCVFAKQSLGPILCDHVHLPAQRSSSTRGSPSPEVTGTFCRVPSPQVTRAPEASRLAYVCPFTVRSSRILPTEAFLGSRLQQTPGPPKGPVALPSRLLGPFRSPERLLGSTGISTPRLCLRSCVPPVGDNAP